jgi:TetR/AcrR family transcriptional regulator, transcriptional repressor for nem operon
VAPPNAPAPSVDAAAAEPRTAEGRDLTPKGRQTRHRIVVAAAGLIFEQGVAGTTLDEVRAAAGVSSSQIYHYFADKEALVLAVVDHQNETTVSLHEEVFATLDSLEALRSWRDLVVDHQRQMQCVGGCPVASLGSELAEADPRARGDVAAGFSRWETAIRHGYEAMHRNGALRPDADSQTLATATLAALQGGLLLSQVARHTGPLEAALDTILAYVATLAPSG